MCELYFWLTHLCLFHIIANFLDRNAITLNNSITYEANSHTIFPSGEMFAEDPIDQNADKSWWDLHWQKAIQWIAFGVRNTTITSI